MPKPARRVVTGHDESGRSVVLSDGMPPNVRDKGTGVDFIEIWNTSATPAPISRREAEPTDGPLRVPPPPQGTRIRLNDFYPGHTRMPVFFGPTPGPRQFRGLERFDWQMQPKRRVLGARFLSDAAVLQSWLPPGFRIWGEPVVTCEVTYFDGFGWLAGRGYNMCDLKFNAVYQGAAEPVHGTLLIVRYENLCDPILSGREELGHNKLWCEIPPIREHEGRAATEMSWLGCTFWKIAAWDLTEAAELPAADPLHRGLLSYKYVPKTGVWGTADVAYATLTPPAWNGRLIRRLVGCGEVQFLRPQWQELPTMFHMINAFCDLPQLESRGGYLYDMQGGASGSETHIVP